MGYSITESNATLGLLIASKVRAAGTTAGRVAEQLGSLAFSVLTGVYTRVKSDVSQQIFVTVAINRLKGTKRWQVRVTFARLVTNDEGQKRAEELRSEDLYRGFFDHSQEQAHGRNLYKSPQGCDKADGRYERYVNVS